ncbi:MAG: c-type cytochrome biogenesis protein CcsB [Cytophagales bacterium]|nr:c-type cytochrome biogenesis protein CcsB [Cytophagales bacterium]
MNSYFKRSPFDWLFATLVVTGALFAWLRYFAHMDYYEVGILVCSAPALIAIAWFWRPLRVLVLATGLLSLWSIWLYQGQLDRANTAFMLKYFLASQTAIMWMSVLLFLSTLFYWLGLLIKSQAATFANIASKMAWVAVMAALVGMMVRWYESYLIGADIGHIPVSNLYEVFVLFCWLTTLFYLYYEEIYNTKTLGAFVMLVVSAAVGFLLWYTFVRDASDIQPLVPALKSWWMKVHVPANFIGYGTFSLSAMVATAYLLKRRFPNSYVMATLPTLEMMDDLMYKAIAVGFAFFTIATVLGAFWAAEAWGGYWSWDPKETWALIVWLNYAAWLHMRLVKGLRGVVAAWWAVVGLLVTTFAFLGVNMFLSGLHSYGTL